jgi:hypothetical protein
MFNFFKTYFKSNDTKIYENFVTDIIDYLYKELKIQKNYLSEIKVYHNESSISCIVRLKFDDQYVKGMKNEFFYFLINCYQSEVTVYGQSLQNSLSDNETEIVWIHENEVLKFHPKKAIMKMLSEKII